MSRYLQHLVMRSLGEGGGLMPRPRTLYETVQADNIRGPSGPIPSLENVDGVIAPGTGSRDAVSGISPAMQPHKSAANDVSSHPLDGVLPAEPGDLNPREADQPVLQQDHAKTSPHIGRTTERRPLAGYPPADAPHPSFGNQVGPFESKEVTRRLDARGEEQVPQENIGKESGEISVAMQGRRTEQTAISASFPIQPPARSVDPIHPTLGETRFHRMRGEVPAPTSGEWPSVVQIRIGRIEVRAVEQPAPVPTKKVVESPRSSLPLDQYLRRRGRET